MDLAQYSACRIWPLRGDVAGLFEAENQPMEARQLADAGLFEAENHQAYRACLQDEPILKSVWLMVVVDQVLQCFSQHSERVFSIVPSRTRDNSADFPVAV